MVLTLLLVAVTWFSGLTSARAISGAMRCHGTTHHAASAVEGDQHHVIHDGAAAKLAKPDDRDDTPHWRSLCCSVHCLTNGIVAEPGPIFAGSHRVCVLPADTRRSGMSPPPLDRPPIA
jgi:hypothetical protein